MRWWNETIAAVGDHLPIGLLALLSIAVTALIAAGLWYWPAWSPTRWPWRTMLRRIRAWRPHWPRWRGWRRRKRTVPVPDDTAADELPDLPAVVLVGDANRHAVEQNYAHAVRERLRAIVRELIERGVIPYRPGWTVAELAASAGQAYPPLVPPLAAAVEVFSSIWYGLRPATMDDDLAMRAYAEAVTRSLTPVSAGRVGTP